MDAFRAVSDVRGSDTLSDGFARVPVNRGEFPDGAKRGNLVGETPRGRTEWRPGSLVRVVNGTGERKTRRDVVFRAAESEQREATGH